MNTLCPYFRDPVFVSVGFEQFEIFAAVQAGYLTVVLRQSVASGFALVVALRVHNLTWHPSINVLNLLWPLGQIKIDKHYWDFHCRSQKLQGKYFSPKSQNFSLRSSVVLQNSYLTLEENYFIVQGMASKPRKNKVMSKFVYLQSYQTLFRLSLKRKPNKWVWLNSTELKT